MYGTMPEPDRPGQTPTDKPTGNTRNDHEIVDAPVTAPPGSNISHHVDKTTQQRTDSGLR
jgi:hypothetical protein